MPRRGNLCGPGKEPHVHSLGGLEATISDWFNEAGGGTAVETAAKVDMTTAKAKPIRKARATSTNDAPAQTETATAVETATEPQVRAEAAPTMKTKPVVVEPGLESAVTEDHEETSVEAPVEATDKATISDPATTESELEVTDEDGQTLAKDAPSEEVADSTDTSPKMNVPRRPKVIAPQGRQLERKAPVKLSGPKVIRVEAPDPVEPPRRRSPPGGGGGGGGGFPRSPGGRGVESMPSGVDDRSRAPRRGGGVGAGPGGGAPNRRRKTEGGGQGDRNKRGRFSRDREFVGPGKFSDADLAEREARLQRSGGYLKQRRQQMRRQQQGERGATGPQTDGKVQIAAPFTIKDLSSATGIKGAEIVKRLFMQGVMATINSGIEPEKAQEVMMDFEIELEVIQRETAEELVEKQAETRERIDERSRGPVVTILGHVDHGKTSLLDRIRSANVADGEAGGITQATSAFRVPVNVGDEEKFIVFIDTPGHEAFTEMRSRGATITDIVVLVVAADDGVMPQTIESISHAKAAGVPIVVALNKMDKAEATDANIQRILGQLAEHDLNPVDWGGETEVVRTSATKDEGIQELLEILDLQSEVLELKSDFGGKAQGSVIEARMEVGRGTVANVLVQEGELKVGDFIVAGRGFGRVRDITDDRGVKIKNAPPPMPVQISGLDEVPSAGDKFYVVDSLKKAQEAAEQRRDREREQQLARPKVTLDSMFSQMAENQKKEILVVVKADVQGSIDVLRNEIEKIASDEVRARVLHTAVGGISESDVILAEASGAVVVGFNVIPTGKARQQAESKGVEIRAYRVIYDLVEDLTKAVEGLLTPDLREEVLGHADVRQVFKVSKVGAIAGCYVTDGQVQRDAYIRVTRDGVVVEHDRKLEQLKRFKDDAKEVRANMECGMKIEHYDDIKEGDVLECYKKIEVKRTL